jgi:hypothetical protein
MRRYVRHFSVELISAGGSVIHIRSPSFLAIPNALVSEGLIDTVRKFRPSSDASKLVVRVWIARSITTIGFSCFSGCKGLKEIVFELKSNVRKFGRFGFSESSLRHISIPDSVERIKKSCFRECLSLFHVELSGESRLKRIEQFAFAFSALDHLRIPPLVEFIDGSAFVETQFTVDSLSLLSERFEIKQFFLRDQSLNCLVRCFDGWDTLRIESSVEVIGRSCFRFCQSLGEVFFAAGSRLRRLDKAAFAFSDLRRITIPSTVSEIGSSCFAHCKRLDIVNFMDGSELKRIEKGAFMSAGLRTIAIPRFVEVISQGAFCSCPRLEDVTFETNSALQRIENSAFAGSALRRIAIPGSVVSMAGSAFVETRVYCISVEGEGSHMVSGSFLHDMENKKVVRYFGSEKVVVIPSFVEVIGSSCFEMVESLEEIAFGEGSMLRRIAKRAFAYSSLRKLMIPNGVESIHGMAFLRTKLSSVCVEPGECRFSVHHGLGEDIQAAAIVFYFGNVRKLILPKSIREISKAAFAMCKSIDELTFEPDSCLTRISRLAFAESSVRRIVIPKSVEFIGTNCFCRCRSLRNVTIEAPSALLEIEDGAFADTLVATITVPRPSDAPPLAFARPGCRIIIRELHL